MIRINNNFNECNVTTIKLEIETSSQFEPLETKHSVALEIYIIACPGITRDIA